MTTTTYIKSIAIGAFALICNFMFASEFSAAEIGSNKDTSVCLKLNGKISKTKESAGQTYTVELVQNDKIVSSQVVKAGQKFKFYLNRNAWYGVKINKTECVSKIISVCTKIPTYQELQMYTVDFKVDEPISYAEAKYLDQDAIDFPLSILSYYDDVENFDGNDEYAKNIKGKLVTKDLVSKDR